MENSKKPPLCNTGAVGILGDGKLESYTVLPDTLNIIIDWLQVTFKDMSVEQVIMILGLESYQYTIVDAGMFGYNISYVFGEKIKLMFHTRNQEIGVHLLLSGRGCREFELLVDWYVLFKNLNELSNINITRLDIAIDDFTGENFTVARIRRYIKNNQVTARFRKADIHTSYLLDGAKLDGETVYFGSPQSKIRIIFYDKLAERKQANYKIHKDVTSWTRTEIRLRQERANEAVAVIVKHKFKIGILASSILQKYIQFRINKKSVKDKKNLPLANWWYIFTNNAEYIELSKIAKQSSLQKKRKYVVGHYRKLLTDLLLGDHEEYNKLLLDLFSSRELDTIRLQRINEYRIQKGEGILTMNKAKKLLEQFDKTNIIKMIDLSKMLG